MLTENIISFLQNRLKNTGIFERVHGLVETMGTSDGKYSPHEYVKKGVYKPIAISAFNGVAYFRKNGDITNVDISALATIGCTNLLGITMPLKVLAFKLKSELPDDCAYTDDALAEKIISVCTTKSSELRKALGAQKVSISFNAFGTNSAIIWGAETNFSENNDVNSKYACVSVDLFVSIEIDRACFKTMCDDSLNIEWSAPPCNGLGELLPENTVDESIVKVYDDASCAGKKMYLKKLIQYILDNVGGGGGVSDHEQLDGLLGGAPGDHYHLTESQLNALLSLLGSYTPSVPEKWIVFDVTQNESDAPTTQTKYNSSEYAVDTTEYITDGVFMIRFNGALFDERVCSIIVNNQNDRNTSLDAGTYQPFIVITKMDGNKLYISPYLLKNGQSQNNLLTSTRISIKLLAIPT